MKVLSLKYLKLLVFGIIIFILLYVNSLGLFGIDLFNFLQILLFLILLVKILKHYANFPPIVKKVFFSGILASSFAIIHSNSFINITEDLGFVSTTATLPIVLTYFFYYFSKRSLSTIERDLLALASFYILSSIPFLLGLLEQNEGADVLWKYGLEEGSEVFFGFYGSVANSSKIITVSLLVAFSYFLTKSKNIYYILLVLVGSYALIFTFARTGWFTFLGGIFILYVGGKQWNEIIKKVVPALIFSVIVIGYIVSTNEFIGRKISGNKVYNEQKEVTLIESYQNSRGGIQLAAVSIIEDMSAGELILGIGLNELKMRMNIYFGSGIVPHNKILMIIIGGGLKMLIMYVIFIVYLFKLIIRFSFINSKDYFIKLPLILFTLFIITQIPSHGFDFFSSLLFALAIIYSFKLRESQFLNNINRLKASYEH